MPVRGHGWYKRPYKMRVTIDPAKLAEHMRSHGEKRPVYTLSFHWKGSRDATAASYRLYSYVKKVEVWDEPVDAVQVRR